ncbi:ABC transporter ATP-binding protein [Virgisporangium aliadipatigenens]|nr:ABC transporter ATP-binding protein [Virgisporangium aliadipatigenens]
MDDTPRDRLGARDAARHAAIALGYARRAAAPLLAARLATTVTGGALPVATAWLTKTVLDIVADPDRPSAALVAPVCALAAAGVLTAVTPQLGGFVDRQLSRRVTLAAKQRMFAAVGRLGGLARFEDPAFHDRLQVAGNATHAPADVVTSGLSLSQAALTVTGFLGTLAVLNPWLLAVVAVAAVPTLHAELAIGRVRARMFWELSHSTRRELFYAQLLTSVTAAKEVRMFGLSGFLGLRMRAEMHAIDRENRRTDVRELRVQAALAVLGALTAGGGLVWAVFAARAGRLSIGDVAVLVAAVAGVQGALSTAVHAIGTGQQTLLVFDHYEHVVRAGADLPQGNRPVPPLRDRVELRDVWFRYAPELPWVLRGVTLSVEAGRATALVGLNGAGKSTLVKLLCRFYDPERGAVLWDGVDVREFDLGQLRERIGVVFQDFMSYELTAAENIAVGDARLLDDPAAARGPVEAAAARAGVDGVLERLPDGYDTMLSRIFLSTADRDDPETGVVLSGGQWQRVALARAYMRDERSLLILDEPSAGLDAAAEHEVHSGLRRHRAGRTSVLISHRLNAIRDADTIAVLSEGVVAESGTHDALVAAGGLYAELFELQSAGYRDPVMP